MAAQPIFHASIEGAQHGAKSLPDFLDYAKRSGASGAQPSNYMLQGGKLFKSAKEIKDTFEQRGSLLLIPADEQRSGRLTNGLVDFFGGHGVRHGDESRAG